MPIRPCSAACTVPSSAPGSRPAASSASSGTVYQQARVVSVRGRKVEVAHLDHPPGGDLRALVGVHVVGHLDRAEVHGAGPDRVALVDRDDRDVGVDARLRVLVASRTTSSQATWST